MSIETLAPLSAAPAARAMEARPANAAKRPKRSPVIAKTIKSRAAIRVLCVVMLFSFHRRALHDDSARSVADVGGPGCAAAEVYDREAVRAFVRDVSGLPVGGDGRPIRLLPDRDAAPGLIRCRIEQQQLAGTLHHDDTEAGAARV